MGDPVEISEDGPLAQLPHSRRRDWLLGSVFGEGGFELFGVLLLLFARRAIIVTKCAQSPLDIVG
jgi:hypothetical protein